MLRAVLSRAASAHRGRSVAPVAKCLLDARLDVFGKSGSQSVRNPFIFQLRQLAGPAPTHALSSTKGLESDEHKPPVLSEEQRSMLALEIKGIGQPKRPDIQALASSFLGGAYLVCNATCRVGYRLISAYLHGFEMRLSGCFKFTCEASTLLLTVNNSWGSMLMFHVGGGSSVVLAPGMLALVKGMVFPMGLSMILLSGSELMTGNFLTQSLPPLKETPLAQRAKTLALSGAGNLAGSLAMVGCVVAVGMFPHGSAAAAHTVAVATGKCSAPVLAQFIKGVGANWLVGVAIFQAASAQTTPGKVSTPIFE
eukprot:1196175-Prorocentrum_minimum.AAC.4